MGESDTGTDSGLEAEAEAEIMARAMVRRMIGRVFAALSILSGLCGLGFYGQPVGPAAIVLGILAVGLGSKSGWIGINLGVLDIIIVLVMFSGWDWVDVLWFGQR